MVPEVRSRDVEENAGRSPNMRKWKMVRLYLRADNHISEPVAVMLMLPEFLRSILIAIMSVAITSTSTTTTTGSLSILADYEVHHSGVDQTDSRTETAPNPSQPADWPSHHRRMPAYRPVNRDLSYAQRPAGNGHPAEYAFIQIMLHGCWINAVCITFFCY